ncbi:hypothetical protein [Desertivirga arenae]|uniref:hypothetical protein n=1 Tax=Desertivirga arenae TaxID=2810309 RepID=UPI001A966F9B|nr:hypothetical protein [Pedobacter sp. SYSU D00823]
MKLIASASLLFLSLSVNAQLFKSYHPGCYYTPEGKKVTGYISSQPYSTSIFFKSEKDGKAVKLDIRDLKSVINSGNQLDSLTVLTEDSDRNKSYLADFLLESPKIKFYHKLKPYSSGGAPTMTTGVSANPSARGSAPSFTTTTSWRTSPVYFGMKTQVMYSDGSTTHRLTKSNFRALLLDAFSDSPEHVQQLQNKKVKYKYVEDFLMSYKYRQQ